MTLGDSKLESQPECEPGQSVAATNSTGQDIMVDSTGNVNSARSPRRKRQSHYIPREHYSAETDEPVSSDAQPTISQAAFEQARRNSLIARRKRRSHYIPREDGLSASTATLPPIQAALPPITNTRCKIAGAGGVGNGKDFVELDGTTMSRIQGVSSFHLPVSCSGGGE